MASLKTLAEQFDELGMEPAPDVIGRCMDLCTTYNITDPVEFVERYMAFSVSNLNGEEPTLHHLADMERKDLAAKLKKDQLHGGKAASALGAQRQTHAYAVQSPSTRVLGNHTMANDEDDIMDSYIACTTPKASNKSRSRLQHLNAPPDSPGSPLLATSQSNAASGQPVYTFGNAGLMKNTNWSTARPKRCTITQLPNGDADGVLGITDKYMYDTLLEKTLIAGDRLFDIGQQILQKLFDDQLVQPQQSSSEVKSMYDNLVYPDQAGPNVVRCLGQIIGESDANIGRFSTMLIGTNDYQLRSVHLNLDKMSSVALFAGQTVCVQGVNPRGDTLYVSEIFAERHLNKVDRPCVMESLKFLIASGPYTLADNLSYEPLHEMLNYCKDNRPDVLVMVGPFVEANHKLVVDGVLVETFDEFFEKIVLLVMDCVGTETQVLMVSSALDAHSNLVYPTHPNKLRRSWPNLMFLPDPSRININGIIIAITSTDVIGHLADAEMTFNAGEKIKRTVNYMFHQASFYPLNPPLHDVCLDSGLLAKFANLRSVPNMLVVPSDLKYFAREINECLVVNPGRIANKDKRGTFVRLVVEPCKEETNMTNYIACQVIKV